MKLIADTSIVIDDFRGGPHWRNFLHTLTEDVELYLPTVVLFEVYSGSSTRDREGINKVKRVLGHFQSIQLTEQIAQRAGELYRDVSHGLGVADYIIAATALDIGADVVTLNRKHFEKIPGVRVYEFE